MHKMPFIEADDILYHEVFPFFIKSVLSTPLFIKKLSAKVCIISTIDLVEKQINFVDLNLLMNDKTLLLVY